MTALRCQRWAVSSRARSSACWREAGFAGPIDVAHGGDPHGAEFPGDRRRSCRRGPQNQAGQKPDNEKAKHECDWVNVDPTASGGKGDELEMGTGSVCH
jgi:hypothetical protein